VFYFHDRESYFEKYGRIAELSWSAFYQEILLNQNCRVPHSVPKVDFFFFIWVIKLTSNRPNKIRNKHGVLCVHIYEKKTYFNDIF